MEPPGNENATRQGGALSTDSADTIADTQDACKRKTPPGHGWEAGKLVPFAPDESAEADASERMEFYRRFSILLDWAMGDELSPKLAAMRVVLNQDRRDAKTIAESLGVVPELIRLRIREARKVLAAAQSETVPLPGAAKP